MEGKWYEGVNVPVIPEKNEKSELELKNEAKMILDYCVEKYPDANLRDIAAHAIVEVLRVTEEGKGEVINRMLDNIRESAPSKKDLLMSSAQKHIFEDKNQNK